MLAPWVLGNTLLFNDRLLLILTFVYTSITYVKGTAFIILLKYEGKRLEDAQW